MSNQEADWKYFVHGTTTSLWHPDKSHWKILGQGGGDFGAGFYTFEDDKWGRESALEWAKLKMKDRGGHLLLVHVRISAQEFSSLKRKEITEQTLDRIYKKLYKRVSSGYELVFGPVGKNSLEGKRVPNKSLPYQYKFEGGGIMKLEIRILELVNLEGK